jgi:nucleoside 2-deoxyribosyltransferase
MQHKNPISVYVAGPDGFSEATSAFLNEKMLPWLRSLGVAIFNPWDLGFGEKFRQVYALPPGELRDTRIDELNMEVGGYNYRNGIAPCTFMIANLDGQEVDSGTASEIGAAAALGKRIFGRRSDLRLSGEYGAIVNLQVAYFVRITGGAIAPSFDALKTVVEAYVAELKAAGHPTL